jgi:hypothetical protein
VVSCSLSLMCLFLVRTRMCSTSVKSKLLIRPDASDEHVGQASSGVAAHVQCPRRVHLTQCAELPHMLQDLARWCWAQDPHERPTFAQVTKFLCLLLEEEESERAAVQVSLPLHARAFP